MNRPARSLATLVLLLAAFAPSLSHADGTMAARTLTASDKARIAGFDASRSKAIDEAKSGGIAADVKVLDAVLAGAPQPILGTDIRGDYRCRTVKLGGTLPLTVYGWFKCRIDEDDLGYRLVKTTGSQRFTGHFIDDSEKRLLFYGAGHYGDEQPRRYKADADRDMVGFLVKAGPKRYRLELPAPKFESTFDIIELERK
ncbi:DUF4893 domain-containing protein [Kaistia geumhonensis]|uniref:DUF4893 domain-containing protein n=1 Tax=Kaistia geumhonensis TaxID=410839 RepID=A0ABU0M2K3_9HYPH|nr:DUF4893 domain-containing protein [Kaistia geumhonensis]MCX5479706.1 DUF4893 domain-containing protein [Kaistia geumhonensis]MDQ0515070.1 hypothetical protein [Kaistia geumhonensis]